MAAAKARGHAFDVVERAMENVMGKSPADHLPDRDQQDRDRVEDQPRRGKADDSANPPGDLAVAEVFDVFVADQLS
jgi:hypothetical protein